MLRVSSLEKCPEKHFRTVGLTPVVVGAMLNVLALAQRQRKASLETGMLIRILNAWSPVKMLDMIDDLSKT